MDTQRAVCRRSFLRQSSAVGAAGVIGTLSGQLLAQEGAGPEKADLAKLTVEDFSALVGSEFRVEHESGRSVAVKLAEASSLRSCGRIGARRPFSVVFSAPRDVSLPQDIYQVRHRQLGSMRLLLVPVVTRSNKVNHFEAIFA